MNQAEQVLIALRKVIRATDLHSKHLAKTIGLTSPQILLLQTIQNNAEVTISKLATEMSLSQPTVTNILDRLERRGYLFRERSTHDKRKVHVHLSEQGLLALSSAPVPLQDRFTDQFDKLEAWEQSMIIASLQRLAHMMNAQDIDASPLLLVGNVHNEDGSAAVN